MKVDITEICIFVPIFIVLVVIMLYVGQMHNLMYEMKSDMQMRIEVLESKVMFIHDGLG